MHFFAGTGAVTRSFLLVFLVLSSLSEQLVRLFGLIEEPTSEIIGASDFIGVELEFLELLVLFN